MNPLDITLYLNTAKKFFKTADPQKVIYYAVQWALTDSNIYCTVLRCLMCLLLQVQEVLHALS